MKKILFFLLFTSCYIFPTQKDSSFCISRDMNGHQRLEEKKQDKNGIIFSIYYVLKEENDNFQKWENDTGIKIYKIKPTDKIIKSESVFKLMQLFFKS